jgi:Sulfotransferase family
LEALLAEVPEARVVWTHRDPAVASASWCSLAAVLTNAASDQVNLGALGRRWLELIQPARGVRRLRYGV